MRRIREDPTASPLGRGLLVYLGAATLLITLAPLRFQWPPRVALDWSLGPAETAANALLFLPLGFLWRLVRGPAPAWLAGALASALIEALQLLTVGRHTSLVDVAANGAGAWLGGALCGRLQDRLNRALARRLALELPLMGLFYMLSPLLWLNGIASGGRPERLLAAALLALCGGSALASLWRHRLAASGTGSRGGMAAAAASWLLVASGPGALARPPAFAALAVALAAAVFVLARPAPVRPGADRRFERPALRRIAVPFAAYLALLALAPWEGGAGRWAWGGGLGWIEADPDPRSVLLLVEYLAACAVLGFLTAEYFGREPARRAPARVAAAGAGAALVLEALRGFHPLYGASPLHGLLAATSVAGGAALYRLQLDALRRAFEEEPEPSPRASRDRSLVADEVGAVVEDGCDVR